MTHIILIHGAWQGSWVWADVVPCLNEAGHSCHAVDLPGSAPDTVDRAKVTFRDQVEYLEDLIAEIGKPVVVVAHSGGGLAASQIAENLPDRVVGIVYVAGIMLPDGTRFAEIVDSCKMAEPSATGVWPHLEHLEGMSAVPEAAAIKVFFHDGAPAAAARAAAKLTPQSNAARDASPHITADCFGTVPRIYIEALKDRSVVPFVQRRMQELVPGAEVRSINTGHAPMVADAALLSEMLVQAVSDLEAG
jgi:pimeloyl-ACP methyl ester carboxylesterase